MSSLSFILIQMLPLLVFVVVDAIFNNIMISIISAIIFAVGQMLFTYARTGTFDYFILVDVVLIAGLGVISIVLKNDLFFKMKPLIIEGIAVLFFAALILLPDRILSGYFSRYMPEGFLNEKTIPLLKTMMIWMSGYTLLHMAAIWYTALYSSRKTWAFVSGPGYYLVFIPVMVWVLVKRRSVSAGKR